MTRIKGSFYLSGDASYTFMYCYNIIEIGDINVSFVTNMSHMFYHANSFNQSLDDGMYLK